MQRWGLTLETWEQQPAEDRATYVAFERAQSQMQAILAHWTSPRS
jgi:hypothetical protein